MLTSKIFFRRSGVVWRLAVEKLILADETWVDHPTLTKSYR